MINLVQFAGFGSLIGPFLGGFLYKLGGYITPLFTFGVLNSIMLVTAFYL